MHNRGSVLLVIVLAALCVRAQDEAAEEEDLDVFRPRPAPGLRRPPEPTYPSVAFSVRKARTDSRPGTRVQFEDVLTNGGEGWDTRNNEFVAPYDGFYFFIFHAVSAFNSDFTMALNLNDRYQVTAYGKSSDYEHGSNSAVLNLEQGDRVSLQLEQGIIYEHPGNEAYTTFSGFLIYT
ncbi:complement C1q-like protein 4 [Homarus americanus]|uniref:complement C1q-like protein 4 n=1 Tax=Homarus americanus TaxID=6706 RepID=UPI001C43935D|nr:complement C1q-like protein 4 [Homarus americanus]